MTKTMKPDWIAVDWGTTHLRLWLMTADGQAVQRIDSNKGMAGLRPDHFEPVLIDALRDHLEPGVTLPVVICGMAGSRQGWAEARYVSVPCKPPGIDQATHVPTRDARIDVHILPGIKQDKPADVMRGEETQIAGVMQIDPGFDGIVCLPGTHCKWAHISAGEVVSFRTFLTGEMFALLSEQSVLRHSVADDGWDGDTFTDALDQAMSRPAAVAAELFSLRAEALLTDLDPITARSRLSGLLIGLELAAAKPYWLGQDVRIAGADKIATAYADALSAQAVPVTILDAETVTLAGLTAAYKTLQDA
ncbi:MAG: 2-dehydro-3-deoxygalactonokinase [Pseudomonadota bacterium]|nr:2-dehydro-3-deoxygalactonokinase [Pseudomonadota bacterium]MEC8581806.1 2-dehydro-3-deoxygalactonokinase [Pseudomonadota bacterium]